MAEVAAGDVTVIYLLRVTELFQKLLNVIVKDAVVEEEVENEEGVEEVEEGEEDVEDKFFTYKQ